MFVSDLADAGFLDRWNVRLREPTGLSDLLARRLRRLIRV
jgi:hypothetical protein